MKLFGTDGVRGVVNKEITPQLCLDIGKTIGVYLQSHNKPKVVLAFDTRTTCDMISNSVTAGLVSAGVDVVNVGISTTPCLCFLTKNCGFDMGVMITASHNNAEYNGIKIFDNMGNKPNDKLEKSLQNIYKDIDKCIYVDFDKYGKVTYKSKLKQKYINFLHKLLQGTSYTGKICFDLSNGASNFVVENIIKQHFDNYVIVGSDTKGTSVNKNCGATNIQNLQNSSQSNNCDIGFAFDGDADRVVMMYKDKVLDGDDILYILARFLQDNKLLNKNIIVGTIMANFGLEQALKEQNIDFVRVDVGDKYIVDYLDKHKLSLGGEQAGHIIPKALSTTGDGFLVSILLIKALEYYGEHFEDIINKIIKYPQCIVNVPVDNDKKQKLLNSDHVRQTLQKCQGMLLNDGRIVLRASGTEPLVRIMVEGKDQSTIYNIANIMANSLKQ